MFNTFRTLTLQDIPGIGNIVLLIKDRLIGLHNGAEVYNQCDQRQQTKPGVFSFAQPLP